MKRILLLLAFFVLAGCQGKGANHTFSNYHNHPVHTVRLLSYNINWGFDTDFKSDPKKTLAALTQIKPDIYVLQEVTKAWEKTLRQHFSHTYPYQHYQYTGNGGGKAILSRYPIIEKRIIPNKFRWYPCQIDLIKTPIGVLQVVNIHLMPSFIPHGIVGLKKVSSFESTNRRLQEIFYFEGYVKKNRPTIIAGDFNESDKGFAVHYLSKLGYRDALLQNKAFFTWHRQYGPIVIKRRMDHVFYADLTAVRAQALYEGGSDHYPLVVDFEQR